MSLPPVHGLPSELVGYIVEFCNDKDTLSSIRLVCKAWEPFARMLLFDRLYIKPGSLKEHCENILSQNGAAILSCVRHLIFDAELDEDGSLEDKLRCLLDPVGRVEEMGIGDPRSLGLSFNRFKDVPFDSGFFTSLSSSFTNIVELNLWFEAGNLKQTIRLLRSFPRLEILGLDFDIEVTSMAPAASDPSTIDTCTLPESLHTFHFGYPLTSKNLVTDFHLWLASHPPRPLTELSILWTPSFVKNLEPYYNLCSKSLESLFLNVYGWNSEIKDCNLSHFGALQTLTLNMGKSDHDFDGILEMLSSLSSPRLRKFIFLIGAYPYDPSRISMWEFDEDLWGGIDELLATEMFVGTVVDVQIVVPYHESFSSVEEQVRGVLKRCHAQGRLSVEGLLATKSRTQKYWTVVDRWRPGRHWL